MSKRLRPIEALAQGRIFACLTLRSSWRRLPPELWDNIFSYFLAATRIEQTVAVEPRVSQLVMNAPVILSLVCKAWKAAVATTPSIWGGICLTAHEDPMKSSQIIRGQNADLLLARLNRLVFDSQRWELTITVNHQSDDADATVHVSLPLLLRCHSSLAFTERLSLSGTRFPTFLRNLTFPRVSSLSVFASRNTIDNEKFLPNLPQLKKVVLTDVRLYFDISVTLVAERLSAFANITHLTLFASPYSLDDVDGIMDACPRLVELVVPVPRDLVSSGLVYKPSQPSGRHLEVLTLICADAGAHLHELCRVVTSRRKRKPTIDPCVKLKQLTILCYYGGTIESRNAACGSAQARLQNNLQSHISKGFKLSITYHAAPDGFNKCRLSEVGRFKHWDFGLTESFMNDPK
ncbi:hypothetical protein NMY22_g2751 [Coprinellus aureogranulatus]|nr:hypothetical protein NMY22_g2751 [Coprinellus aureogranulatus]